MSSNNLIPDGFDLEAARKARSTTPRSHRKRCPECGAASIDRRVDKNNDFDHDWRCSVCGERFDTPEEPRPGTRGEAA